MLHHPQLIETSRVKNEHHHSLCMQKKHAGNKTKTYKKDIDFGSGPTTCLMSASVSTVNLELVKYENCLELQYWVQET
jgi:hypothetical protein